jgi:hypothetical protein
MPKSSRAIKRGEQTESRKERL